jgi:signal transduction histidine kinase
MNKNKEIVLKIKNVVAVIVVITTIYFFYSRIEMSVFLLIIQIIVFLNEYFRKINISNNKKYYASIIISIVGISILKFFLGGICYIYILFSMIDIIIKEKNNIKKGIIYIHAVGYFGPDIYNYISNNNYKINYFYAVDNVITYLGFICLLFSIRYVNIERGKVNELNEDLNIKNQELIEYSKKIQELSVANERSRLAQELHDSLGHSLIAIKMNLEVLERTNDLNYSKKIIETVSNIVKSSIYNLKRTVYELNYASENNNELENALEELIKNVTLSKNLKINMDFDKHLRGVSIDIKDTIYKTIQESLTNSISHGQAAQVSICIKLRKRVYIVFKDNGIGCNVLNKSNGLKGIEKRISLLGGGVKFRTKMDKGFTTIAFIPIKWGENYD